MCFYCEIALGMKFCNFILALKNFFNVTDKIVTKDFYLKIFSFLNFIFLDKSLIFVMYQNKLICKHEIHSNKFCKI